MREKFYILLKEHFINLESKLNQLDAVIGDGDHGSTLLKGLSAIPNSELPPDKAFKAETGGASGSLFSILIGAIDKGMENSSNFGEFLTNASNRISMIGEAKEGDKTMLDALIPAAKASLNDPKIANITSVDYNLLIQKTPGEKIFFKLIELHEAEQLYKEHVNNISETINNIKELN